MAETLLPQRNSSTATKILPMLDYWQKCWLKLPLGTRAGAHPAFRHNTYASQSMARMQLQLPTQTQNGALRCARRIRGQALMDKQAIQL